MGFISGLVDATILLFSVILSIAIPLIDSQAIAPPYLHPPFLVELKQWYGNVYGDYLLKEKPHFFVGLVWLEIFYLWPLSILNVYGILGRRNWVKTTLLMAGASTVTSMAAVMGELLGSGRATEKLLQMYTPFAAFAVLATLRGLFPPRHSASGTSASHAPSRKKRA